MSIGYWNHRVVKRTCKVTGDVYYQIEECHYEARRKTPRCITNGLTIGGESVKDLEWTLKQMLKCLKNPIVNGDKYENSFRDKE